MIIKKVATGHMWECSDGERFEAEYRALRHEADYWEKRCQAEARSRTTASPFGDDCYKLKEQYNELAAALLGADLQEDYAVPCHGAALEWVRVLLEYRDELFEWRKMSESIRQSLSVVSAVLDGVK